MNAVFPVAVLCLGLGFAAGWLVKSETVIPETSSHAEAKSASPSSAEGRGDGSSNPSAVEKSKPWQAKTDKEVTESVASAHSGVGAREAEAVDQASQKSHLKMLRDSHRRRFEARLQKLIAPLGLTDEQQARLRADAEARLAGLEKLPPGAIHDGAHMEKVFASLDPLALDKDLEKLLTGEQPEKFQALKARETESKIESRAFKSMSNLSRVVALEENQRRAVFAVLEEEARQAEAQAQQPSMMNLHEVFMQDMGVESNDELGLSKIMMDEMEAFQSSKDLIAPGGAVTDIQTRIRAVAEKRIEEKVNLLAPHLNPEQLSQYQSHLENTAANMLRMMGGFEVEE